MTTQLQQYCQKLSLPTKTVDFLARVVQSEPVRRVQGRGGNVSGFFSSRKMGITIQFESLIELGAIYLMERDPSVFAFYDQPHTFKLRYLNKTGKRMQGHYYTPDFLVLRPTRAVLEEWKTEKELQKLVERQPYRYQRTEDGGWCSPPGEEVAQELGLSFRVCSSALLPQVQIDNQDFLADYFRITPLNPRAHCGPSPHTCSRSKIALNERKQLLMLIRAVLNGSLGRISLGPTPLGVGRDPDNALVVSDVQCSSHHFKITPTSDGVNYQITDLNSVNGTFVNEQRLTPTMPHPLSNGDIIRIGRLHFIYERKNPVEIFCCYAREDQEMLTQLVKHLAPLKRQGQIMIWSDTDLSAGVEWEKVLHQHLESANIILLLISPDFMNSDYCYSTEMGRALERHDQGSAVVIPILLRPTSFWRSAPFAKLQILPKDARPIRSWPDIDDALSDVTERINQIVPKFLS